MKQTQLSVLIVTYNCKTDLKRCLESLHPQIQNNREVIVLDNASTDGTVQMLKTDYPWVKPIFSHQNLGLAQGLRQAAQLATGDWLLLLNDDTIIPRGSIDGLTAFAGSHPRIGAVAPRIRDGKGNIEYTARKFPTPVNALFGRYTLLSRIWPNNAITRNFLNFTAQSACRPFACDWGSFAAVLVRKKALESIDSIDPGFFVYWSDADFFYRLKKRDWEVWCTPDVEMIHMEYYRPNRKRSPLSILDFHRGALRYYYKHHGLNGWNPLFWLGSTALLLKMLATLIVNHIRCEHE